MKSIRAARRIDPDWIELYNSATQQKDVSGYKIYDSGGKDGSKPKMTLPAGTTIPALGFLVVVVDDTTDAGFRPLQRR